MSVKNSRSEREVTRTARRVASRGLLGAAATIGLMAFGAAEASATSFCYRLVEPHSQCSQTSQQGPNTQVLADYDGDNANNTRVCARINYSTYYTRACDENYIYLGGTGATSIGIVGNDSNYRHTIKGENWF